MRLHQQSTSIAFFWQATRLDGLEAVLTACCSAQARDKRRWAGAVLVRRLDQVIDKDDIRSWTGSATEARAGTMGTALFASSGIVVAVDRWGVLGGWLEGLLLMWSRSERFLSLLLVLCCSWMSWMLCSYCLATML